MASWCSLWVRYAFLTGESFYAQHSLDREACARGDVFVDRDLVLHRLQRAADVAERDRLHVRAKIAQRDEFEVRVLEGDVVAHRTFRQKHAPRWPFGGDVERQGGRRAGEIGLRQYVWRGFRGGPHDE